MAKEYINKKDASRLFVAMRDNGKRFKVIMNEDGMPIINEKEKNIKLLHRAETHLCFEYRERHFHCALLKSNRNSFTMLVNGVEYTFNVETVSSYLRKKILTRDKSEDQDLTIKAPMPGKITAVYKEEGEEVNVGDPLFALEAMKMQNEILSPVKGKILELNIKKDDVVMKNDELLKLGDFD